MVNGTSKKKLHELLQRRTLETHKKTEEIEIMIMQFKYNVEKRYL